MEAPSGDVIDEIANGGLLTVPQAAAICEVTDQSIYRWLDHAALKGQPLGKKSATWLIGTARLSTTLRRIRGFTGAREGREPAEEILADLGAGRRAALRNVKERATSTSALGTISDLQTVFGADFGL